MATKKELLAQEVSRAVGAGKAVAMQTVDFNDPNRPKTCLEVDFPILPVNQIAVLEGNASKPIYQMSKWWARRRSSVFRSMLIAAATKAPEDTSVAAKLVWDNYYANHAKKGAFQNLKVADIFMGGGTTLVEGSRLGMQMSGNDLNPVAWFIVKQELANVDLDDVRRLLAEVESDVKPQIQPFYACNGPKGEKGKWTEVSTGSPVADEFDPTKLRPEDRKKYSYSGPEVIYTFWAKHGPCLVTGCGHLTPIMSSPVMAVKTMSVKSWPHVCDKCGQDFDIEDGPARMAPDAPLHVVPGQRAYAVADPKRGIICPNCKRQSMVKLGKGENKRIELSLIVLPKWLEGSSKPPAEKAGEPKHKGSAPWNAKRSDNLDLLEVRGKLPDTFEWNGETICAGAKGGTVPKSGHFVCASCGTTQRIVEAIEANGTTAPISPYAVQCYSPHLHDSSNSYGGRFFSSDINIAAFNAADIEWNTRKEGDLKDYWPGSEIPFGHMTHQRQPLPRHGYNRWSDMFNSRQLLVHALLLKAIWTVGTHDDKTREYVLGAFQQYLRNQNLFCFWDISRDGLAPLLSNANFHPKANIIENCVFSVLGRGNWISCVEGIVEGAEWVKNPWEPVSVEMLSRNENGKAPKGGPKSEKVFPGDAVRESTTHQGSSTDLKYLADNSIDLVITDPPFGGLLHYSELSDFFYVWLRLVLAKKYPASFGPEYSPKSMEAVANKARQPDDADAFYQRVLTECWREAGRALKPSGILAFTFHHSEDAPWVSVLESLFEAGFYLEATYPIRSDETKGEGEFGSKTVEYDIIHVCRKRNLDPQSVSWARMRREVLSDVRQIEAMLANHAKDGLPSADLQVIRRGKALEYFSRHYGKVLVEEGRALSVAEALIGINQLIDEGTEVSADLVPVNAEPLTRQFLRIFRGKKDVERDQLQKFLRGTGVAPDEFTHREWTKEQSKLFSVVPSSEFAIQWKGRQRKGLTHDYDQAWFLIGACHDGTGINASEQLRNSNFKPHPALKPLLDWFSRNGIDAKTRQAAVRAGTIYNAWADSNQDVVSKQMEMFA